MRVEGNEEVGKERSAVALTKIDQPADLSESANIIS